MLNLIFSDLLSNIAKAKIKLVIYNYQLRIPIQLPLHCLRLY